MKKPNLKQLELEVSTWNDKNDVGCDCEVKKDDGSIFKTKTRSDAWVLSGHSAVISVEGIFGCYLLNRVSAV